MSSPIPTGVLVATSIGLTMNAYFSSGNLALSYFALPAILLPDDAPLIPPLELVKKAKERHFRTEPVPTQPADSGVGDESESLLDSGATTRKTKSSPSSTEYLLRQWFHVFAKGMHTYPPFALGGAVSYLYCTVMLPGPVFDSSFPLLMTKRGLYVLASLLSASIVAFTLTKLKPTNAALHKKVEEVMEREGSDTKPESGKDEKKDVDAFESDHLWVKPVAGEHHEDSGDEKVETEALIRKWGKLNAIRSGLPFAASVVAVIALITPFDS